MSISANLPAFCLLFLAVSCGEAEQAKPKQATPKPAPAPAPKDKEAPPPGQSEAGEPIRGNDPSAADVLRLYYGLIGTRRYEDARRLRESRLRESRRREASEAEFAANFERYAEHHATVGTASLVAEAGEWLYVDVPVQRYGKFRDGKTFANAGTVTLRRRKSGGEWRIFTSG